MKPGSKQLVHSCSGPLVVRENNSVGCSPSVQGKSGEGNLNSGNDDDTQADTDLLNTWMQRLQILTVVVR